MFGWKGDALQRAMDDNGCFSATCGKQKSQDISAAKKCTIKKTVQEDVDGCKFTNDPLSDIRPSKKIKWLTRVQGLRSYQGALCHRDSCSPFSYQRDGIRSCCNRFMSGSLVKL